MSSPREKAASFSTWTIVGDDGLECRPEIWMNESLDMLDDDLHPAEREFRRKSRAFAVAAAQKRAARRKDKQGRKNEERVERDRRNEGKEGKRKNEERNDLDPKTVSTKLPPTIDISTLFDSLAFYYIPNAELGPRKLRIAKARQHGAQWVQQITKATHVIVDKNLSWKDIQVVLRDVDRPTEDSWPFVLVNEEYPLDCISYRRMLNPEQRRYFIRGSPAFDTRTRVEALPRNPCKTRRLDKQIKPDKHRRRLSTP